ncbi:hypothetical protein ACOJA0_05860 [Corynebacterium amycolatum]|uniref:hypothetical protein n=1 Tax=Corynebacterium amycolatum TaxID=43765 RepID=UPI003B5BA7EE
MNTTTSSRGSLAGSFPDLHTTVDDLVTQGVSMQRPRESQNLLVPKQESSKN